LGRQAAANSWLPSSHSGWSVSQLRIT
jgi:hypothetical protein